MKNNKYSLILIALLMFVFNTAFTYVPEAELETGVDIGLYYGGGDGSTGSEPLDDLLDEIKGWAEKIIMFMIFLGGIVMTVGLVWSMLKGSLNQALGSSAGLSQAVIGGMTIVAAFVFMISTWQIAKNVATNMSDKYAQDIQITAAHELIGSGGGGGSEAMAFDAIEDQIANGASVLITFMIGLATIVFFIAAVKSGLTAQIGAAMGASQLVSSSGFAFGGAIVSFALVLLAYPLSNALMHQIIPALMSDITIP